MEIPDGACRQGIAPTPGSSANRKLSLRTPRPKSAIYSSSGLLAANLPLLPSRLQLPVPLRVDLQLSSCQDVFRRDVTNRAVQPDIAVTPDKTLHQAPRTSLCLRALAGEADGQLVLIGCLPDKYPNQERELE